MHPKLLAKKHKRETEYLQRLFYADYVFLEKAFTIKNLELDNVLVPLLFGQLCACEIFGSELKRDRWEDKHIGVICHLKNFQDRKDKGLRPGTQYGITTRTNMEKADELVPISEQVDLKFDLPQSKLWQARSQVKKLVMYLVANEVLKAKEVGSQIFIETSSLINAIENFIEARDSIEGFFPNRVKKAIKCQVKPVITDQPMTTKRKIFNPQILESIGSFLKSKQLRESEKRDTEKILKKFLKWESRFRNRNGRDYGENTLRKHIRKALKLSQE